ncbi:peptide chain release factor N(5)-glutamine methyltransferase, partial [Eubacteriales bacterium OttesenSCG-928-K08]|nr:peptide chain release factor N(5)-glutamine methyltransferase [Eubacteriales bacterium OttesenSCG-928-K08]
ERRRMHEPLQYIFGEWFFMGLPFLVRPGVLIPRQDTETLCEAAIEILRARKYKTALDLCCGTGCVGISLKKLCGVDVTMTDISPACVTIARENAQRNGVSIQTLEGSFFEPVSGRFDMIVSNPPYLTAADMSALQPEVRHEPGLALYGGEDGLAAYRIIAGQYKKHINPGGILLLEVGFNQADDVRALFNAKTNTYRDMQNIERVVCVQN